MVNSSININKTIKQLPLTSTYWTYNKSKPWHVAFGILVMALYRYRNVAKLGTRLYNPTPPVIDIRISSECADIHKQSKKSLHRPSSTKKDHTRWMTSCKWQYSTRWRTISWVKSFFFPIFNVLQKVLLNAKATRKRSQLQRPFLYRICFNNTFCKPKKMKENRFHLIWIMIT